MATPTLSPTHYLLQPNDQATPTEPVNSPRFGTALSCHPDSAVATAELVGQLQDISPDSPSVVALFISGDHEKFCVEILTTVNAMMDPMCSVGCVASGVVGRGEFVPSANALAIWAAWDLPVQPLKISASRSPNLIWDGFPFQIEPGSVAVVLVDPAALASDLVAREFNERYHNVALIGGVGSGSAGSACVLVDGDVHSGAVGFVVEPGSATHHHLRHPSVEVLDKLTNPLTIASSLLFHSASVPLRDAVWSEHGSALVNNTEIGDGLAGMLTAGELACREGHNASHLLSAGLLVFTNS